MFKRSLITLLLLLIIQPCFASTKTLKDSWHFYKSVYINNDGRVIDYQKQDITTSEGQSYALLRAVLMNERKTFDKVYDWTRLNLKRENDSLFAWLWGKRDCDYGIIDSNSATDSDIDIAFALILASKKWNNQPYLKDAKKIIADIWKYETIDVNTKRILTAGYNQSEKDIVDINPSYFAPYAFRAFATFDDNNWNKLIDDNYELLGNVINSTDSKLPPDWFTINKTTGEIYIDKNSSKSDFSYDAVRVFFRLYLDYKLNAEKRAEPILSNVDFFIGNWNNNSKFRTNVKSNAEFRDDNEPTGSIMLLLPIIKMYNQQVAQEIYTAKIKPNYNDFGYWGSPYDYYAQNLTWFGYKELFDAKYNK